MAHARIWKFRPPSGGERAFVSAYAADGPWAELFGRAEGFLGITLMRPAGGEDWWLTVDRWSSARAFEVFQREFAEDYRALDAELEGAAGEEVFVGVFEVDC